MNEMAMLKINIGAENSPTNPLLTKAGSLIHATFIIAKIAAEGRMIPLATKKNQGRKGNGLPVATSFAMRRVDAAASEAL